MIRRSGDVVCSLYHARGDEEHEFLDSASKLRSMVSQWFGRKTTGTVFSSLTSKSVVTVSLSLALKLVVGFLVEPQN
jgi:hypothetical protein